MNEAEAFNHRATQWSEFLNGLDDAYDIGLTMLVKRDTDEDLGLAGDLYYLGKLHEFFLIAGAETDLEFAVTNAEKARLEVVVATNPLPIPAHEADQSAANLGLVIPSSLPYNHRLTTQHQHYTFATVDNGPLFLMQAQQLGTNVSYNGQIKRLVLPMTAFEAAHNAVNQATPVKVH